VKRIVLLGFDMRKVDGKNNWHDYHDEMTTEYDKHLLPMQQVAVEAKELGLEIINATPGSAITVWPIVDPADVMSKGV
jgi:hypothetical protein